MSPPPGGLHLFIALIFTTFAGSKVSRKDRKEKNKVRKVMSLIFFANSFQTLATFA
jgi:hypothetical protein